LDNQRRLLLDKIRQQQHQGLDEEELLNHMARRWTEKKFSSLPDSIQEALRLKKCYSSMIVLLLM